MAGIVFHPQFPGIFAGECIDFSLTGRSAVTIGRREACHFTIEKPENLPPEDTFYWREISGCQCRLRLEAGICYLMDGCIFRSPTENSTTRKRSTNGVYVNGELIGPEEVALSHMDKVALHAGAEWARFIFVNSCDLTFIHEDHWVGHGWPKVVKGIQRVPAGNGDAGESTLASEAAPWYEETNQWGVIGFTLDTLLGKESGLLTRILAGIALVIVGVLIVWGASLLGL